MFNSLHEECGVFGIFENKTTYLLNITAVVEPGYPISETAITTVNEKDAFLGITEATVLFRMYLQVISLMRSVQAIWQSVT